MTNQQQPTPNFDKNIQAKFSKGFVWNLSGSILYEITKTLHLFFLMRCSTGDGYGIIGSIFTMAYFATALIDLGASNSLPPFIGIFTKSKESFRKLLIYYYSIPFSMGLFIAFAALLFFFGNNAIVHDFPGLFIIVPLIIIFETIITFFRLMLHLFFKSKYIVIFETIFIFLYFSSIWIAYLGFGASINPYLVLIPHCIDSFSVLTFCSIMLYRHYQKLPSSQELLPTGITKRIVSTRCYNYLLRLSRHMFTNGVLTPFFAYKFGFHAAGLYYFASTFAASLQTIIKSIMVFSGNAFLANVKECSLEVKKYAFGILSQKLATVITPVIIFLAINFKTILHLAQRHDEMNTIIAFILLFILITTTEFFLILYEQFYIIEEASSKIFLFKAVEMILFALAVTTMSESIFSTLIAIIIIRLLSFFIIATSAFFQWGIRPNFIPSAKIIAASITIATIVAYLIP